MATADPTGAARRQAQARRGRFVAHHRPQVAGEEGRLVAAGPAERVAICAETIEAIARGWARAGVSGTLDQLRFDALVALVTGADPTTPPDRDGDPDPDEAGLACPESDPDLDFDAEADVDPVSDPDPDPGDIQGTAGSRGDLCAVAGDPDQNGEDRVAATAAGGDAGVFARPGGSDRGREMCRCGGRVRPVVAAQVTVALSTLVGLDDAPGELAGVGSVPAEVARELAAQAVVWRRLLTDPADGHLVTQVIRSYRPTAAMRRFVLTRAGGVCASRGCTARHGLQIDHDEPFPGGPTSATNNVPLHQPHHDGKTCGAWQHRLDPVTGALRQVSPLGRVYTTRALPPWAGRGTARRVGWTRRRCWPRSWLAGRTRRRSRQPGPEEEATYPPDPVVG